MKITDCFKWLINAIRNLSKLKSVKIIASILGLFGIGTAAKGGTDLHKAKKTNSEATRLVNKAMRVQEETINSVNESLASLGEKQIRFLKTTEDFSNIIGKIQNQPNIRKLTISNSNISKIDIGNVKRLNQDFEIAVKTVGAGGISACTTALALGGISAFVLSPAMFTGGIILFAEGKKRKEKANANLKKAQDFDRSIRERSKEIKKIQVASERLAAAIDEIFPIYMAHMNSVYNTTLVKTDFKSFSKDEKLILKNYISLFQLLYTIVQVQLVKSPKKREEKETEFNEKDVNDYISCVSKEFDEIKATSLLTA